MKRIHSLISVLIAVVLFLLPAGTALGELNQAKTFQTKEMKDLALHLQSGKAPKLEENDNRTSYYNPASYPLIPDGAFAGSLFDGFSSRHDIIYETTAEYSINEMSIQLLYGSDNLYYKDSLLTIEFFTKEDQSLTYLGSIEFDTYGEDLLRLQSILPKDFYTNKEHIYIRMGLSEGPLDSYYSDTLLFKVNNPFFNPEVTSPDKFLLINNESTVAEQTQFTGQFKVNNSEYSFNKNLRLGAFKLDVKRPFDVKKNKDRKLNTYNKLSTYEIGQSNDFWVYNFETGMDQRINATLMYTGSKTNIWVNNNQLTTLDAEKLGKEFDEKIHPIITSNFAKESDVNGDGKVNILTYDIQDGFQGTGGYIAGYFYPGDLFNSSYSNMSEIFYIDTYPLMGTAATKDVSQSYETLAHEFQHMVNFNQNVFIEGSDSGMDVWLDEALAMAAEQVYSGKVLTDRIDYYNYSSSIANGHSLLYWDYYGDVLANYSLSYLFGQYVKLQAGNGNTVFKEIINDSSNDYKAVENVIKKYVDSNLTFGKFMTHFRTALLLKENSGLNGFKGVTEFNDLTPRLYTGSSQNLRGGGAVVKSVSSFDNFPIPADKGSDISYTLIGQSDLDVTPPEKPTVNPVSDAERVVTGIAEPGSTVHVLAGNSALGQTVTDSTGNFMVEMDAQPAGTVLTIYVMDPSGNKSEHTNVIVADQTAPATPLVNPVKDHDLQVTGSAESNSTVTVYSGNTILGSSSAAQDGSFTVQMKAPQKAGSLLSITSRDKAGHESEAAKVIVEDGTAPSAPVVNQIRDYDKKITGKSEAGSRVTAKIGSKVLGQAMADQYGSFSITLTAAQKAGTILTFTAADKAGNTSPSASVTVIDKTAPINTTVNQVRDFDRKVIGKAEPGSKITVKSGKTVLGYGVTSKYGSFSVSLRAPQKAGTVLSVTATDKAGNVSKTIHVTVKDKTAPSAPVVNAVKDYDRKVTGKAEPYAKVTVKSGKTTVGYGTADKSGRFAVNLRATQKAGIVLTIFAADKSNNISKPTYKRVIDKTAPKAPTVNKITTRTTIAAGKAEPNSTVYIKSGSKVIGKGRASKTGVYKIKIARQKYGTSLIVFAKDTAGNTSKSIKVTVKR